MSMLSNLDLIRRVSLFAMLTPAQAELLANVVTKRRYKRGEVIVEKGKISNALFIMLSGNARVSMMDAKGREVILATLQAGDYVGEMSLIDSEPHSATVQADVLSDVLILGRVDFMNCLMDNTSMAYSVMRGLVQRLRAADQKIESLALQSVYGRVANVLLEAAVPDDNGGLIIKNKVSRQDLAKMVGASREMVSRVMKDFEETGFIETLDTGVVRVWERRAPQN
jgi:CRP/FNR family transcriptional regulator, cyclic AMP receptor protein